MQRFSCKSLNKADLRTVLATPRLQLTSTRICSYGHSQFEVLLSKLPSFQTIYRSLGIGSAKTHTSCYLYVVGTGAVLLLKVVAWKPPSAANRDAGSCLCLRAYEYGLARRCQVH